MAKINDRINRQGGPVSGGRPKGAKPLTPAQKRANLKRSVEQAKAAGASVGAPTALERAKARHAGATNTLRPLTKVEQIREAGLA